MKRALLIGIDTYDNFTRLSGCVNDVDALRPLLARNEDDSPNFDCQTLTSGPARVDRDIFLRSIDRLLSGGAEQALLYFAGHGAQTVADVTLVVQDGTERTPGVALSEILGTVRSSPVREVVIVLDCCFSGGAGGSPQLGEQNAVIRNGVTIITASRDDQPSEETSVGRGLFSTFFEGAVRGGAADVVGKVTLAGVYAYLSESFGAWEQRPTLKTNIEQVVDSRTCAPAVPLAELRELPTLFPVAEGERELDASYEPTVEPHDTEHERIFGLLQRCRAAKLVVPVGTDHLYFAAMEGRACRLTPLGRHYRHMAERGRL